MVNIRAIGKKFTEAEGRQLLEDAEKIVSGKVPNKIKQDRNELLNTPKTKVTVDEKPVTVKEGTDTIVKVDTKIKKPTVDEETAKNFLFKTKNTKLTPKQLSDFNIDNLNTKDAIVKYIEEVSQTFKKDISTRTGGVQTNDATRELADLLQTNPKKLTSQLLGVKKGQTLNAATILAARDVLVSAYNKLDELALVAQKGTPDDLLKFRQHLALTTELHKIVKGVQTETARALQQFQIPVRNKKFTSVDLDDLNKNNLLIELGGTDEIRNVATLYLRTSSQKERTMFAEKVGTATKVSQALSEIFINALLSNPITHVRNTAGNWITQGIVQAERKFASRVFGDATSGGVAEWEDIAKAFGKTQAFTEMWAAMSKSFKSGELPNIASQFGGSKIEVKPGALTAANLSMKEGKAADFVDLVGKVLTLNRIPTKFLTQADNFFKNMEYRSEIYALAYRDTVKKVRDGFLKKEDAADYLANLVVNPDKTMVEEAYKAAQYTTFQTKMGTRGDFLDLGKGLQTFKNKSGPLNFFANYYLPFIQTPTNVAGFVLERTPGLNLLLKSYREDLFSGNTARAQLAKSKMMLGSAFFTTIMGMSASGYIRGTNIDIAGDVSQKAAMEKTLGMQKGVLIIGNTQYQLQDFAFDPLAMYIKQAADFAEIIKMGFKDHDQIQDFEKYLAAFMLSVGENIASSTYMAGIGKLVEDYQNYKDYGLEKGFKTQLQRATSSFVPAIVRQAGNLMSDGDRKIATEFNEWLQKSIYDRNLNPEFDLLGDKIEKWGSVTELKQDPIRDELKKSGVAVDPVKKSTTINFKDGLTANVQYTSNELSFIQQRSGQYAKAELENLFSNPIYQSPETDDFWKQQAIKKVFSDARQTAYADLVNAGNRRAEPYQDWENVQTRIEGQAKDVAYNKIVTANRGKPLQQNYEKIMPETTP